jgi:adenylyl- and sulfurtransferase ThiI
VRCVSFTDSPKFAIHTNSRNSDRLDRLDMIKRVADEVVALGNGHTVDLKSPDRTVLVEVNKVGTRARAARGAIILAAYRSRRYSCT